MNMPIKPACKIEGDSPSRIMERSGELTGLSKTRAVWRFGFLPDSDHARAYGVQTDSFVWIISDHAGNVLDSFNGYAIELPARYKSIIDSKL
jgi:hypothetical protein